MSEAQSAARLRMLSQPGHLYAAYSRYCDWIKLGFTLSLDNRLKSLAHQYDEFAPFSLIGSTRSTWSAEQQLHLLLGPFRQRQTGRTKELYPAVRSIVSTVKAVLKYPTWERLEWEQTREMLDWVHMAAKAPPNRDEALQCFDRFYAERRAARAASRAQEANQQVRA